GTWGTSGQTITITSAPGSGSALWTVSGGHHLALGAAVQFTGGTLPTGFFPNVTYWVSATGLTPTTFELQISKVGAGSPLNATGSGSGTITLQQQQCSGGQIWKIPTMANAPASQAQYLSEANYYNGVQFGPSGVNPSVWAPSHIGQISGTDQLLNQAYNYVNGNSTQQAAALAFMDNDTRVGTIAPNPITSNCPASPAIFTTPVPLSLYSTSYSGPQTTTFLTTIGAGTLPTGFSPNTQYLLVSQGTNTFELKSATNPPGSVLGCTGAGTGQLAAMPPVCASLLALSGFTGSGV